MIRYELADGRIVDAEKECTCITHEGPCWVYFDRIWRENNWANVRAKQAQGIEPTWLDALGLSQEELPRLREKRRQMERRGIVRIIEEGAAV